MGNDGEHYGKHSCEAGNLCFLYEHELHYRNAFELLVHNHLYRYSLEVI